MKKELIISTVLVNTNMNSIAVNIFNKDGEIEQVIEPGPSGCGNHIAVAIDELLEREVPFGTKVKIIIEVEE